MRKISMLLVVLALLLPGLSKAQSSWNESVLLYNGNAFYWAGEKIDTVRIIDPETDEVLLRIIVWEAAIARMNEDTVYSSRNYKEAIPPVFEYNGLDEQGYFSTLFRSKAELQNIPSFTIQKMVINKAGKPVYFELMFDDSANARALKMKWGAAIEKYIVNMPRWKPASYKGKTVPFYLSSEIHISSKKTS